MYHALIRILLSVSLLPVIASMALPQLELVESDSGVHDYICPDGLPGLVTQTQYARLEPFQPDIYITDCAPSRHTVATDSSLKRSAETLPRLQTRQEQICPADCSNSCSSGTAPSTSDCNALVTYLNNRDSQWTVQGFGIHTESSGTCSFQLVNMDASSLIYCDTALANRGNSVVSQCPSGGMCQGSRFQAKVFGSAAVDPAPSPAQTSDPPTPSQGTGSSGSSNGNSGSSSNVANGATTLNNGNAGSSAAASNGASATLSNAASGALSEATGSVIGGRTGSQVTVSTTLSNGEVTPVSVSNIPLPSESSQSAATGPVSNYHSSNVPAIVGVVLGILSIIALLAFLVWRRKRRNLRERIYSDEYLPHENQGPEPTLAATTPYREEKLRPSTTEVAAAPAWATSTKARMIAEESLGHRRHNGSSTSLTASSGPRLGPSTTDSSVLPYRSRSGRGRHYHSRTESGRTDPQQPQPHHRPQGSATTSDSLSSVTGSPQLSQAATFARNAAPNLSAIDIDRLAENIVARMHGRDPVILLGAGAVMEADENEPPPPWSAPVHDQRDPHALPV